MNYKNSAKVCMYNYFRDFGYEEDINKLDEIVNLDNCDNPLEFIKKLESLKLKATISALSLNNFNKERNVPFFAICELERGKTFYLPIYKIEIDENNDTLDNDFIVLKDAKGKSMRIKLSLFNQIYQGKIIEITNNKQFLKERFLKEEHKKRAISCAFASVSLALLLTAIILLITAALRKEPFEDGLTIALYISLPVFGIMFIVFLFFFLQHYTKIYNVRNGRNKNYLYNYHGGNYNYGVDVAGATIESVLRIIFECLK